MALVDDLNSMRSYFMSNVTYPVSFRKQQLKKLKTVLMRYEEKIYDALNADLKKSPEESWITENGFLISEINYALKHINNWTSPQRVSTNLLNFPSKSYVVAEPLGVVLIISPWNYPLQLLIGPLIGAMAAGNCAVLKPSEFAPATESLISEMISETFSPDYIRVVKGEGSRVVPEMISKFRFDHLFYTGSTAVGKMIYQMAATQLIPVTLEMGGKSPVIVECDANLSIAAKRIVMAKFSNCGQMCVAPDYVLVHSSVENKFVELLVHYIKKFFTADPASCYDYGKIINQKHFKRLTSYLNDGRILFGGEVNEAERFISPTLISDITPGSKIMEDEIFGPLLPVIPFNANEEALRIIEKHSNPLAFYIFSSSKKNQKYWVEQVRCGGVCINSTAIHLTNPSLPFGGRGNSGMGQYHGKYGFDCFSHPKAVMNVPAWFDPSIKYPSYKGKLPLFRKIIR